MSSGKGWVVLFLVIIAAAVIGYFVVADADLNLAPSVAGDRSTYQAVFLANNQVYFGKISNENSQYPVLTDIYYLQVNQALQPKDASTSASPDVNLVKLGGELHGPLDEMRINRDHILLIEDLRADSNVVKAIEGYKQQQAQPAE